MHRKLPWNIPRGYSRYIANIPWICRKYTTEGISPKYPPVDPVWWMTHPILRTRDAYASSGRIQISTSRTSSSIHQSILRQDSVKLFFLAWNISTLMLWYFYECLYRSFPRKHCTRQHICSPWQLGAARTPALRLVRYSWRSAKNPVCSRTSRMVIIH